MPDVDMKESSKGKKLSPQKTFLKKHWFLIALGCLVLLARTAPAVGKKHGPLHPEFFISKLAVGFIFFCSGLGTDVSQMKSALARFDFYAVVLGYNLFLVPCFVSVFVFFLRHMFGMNEIILTGLFVVGALPPPVSSAVILTRTVGGSTPLAICASVMGSLIGIFTTPLMLVLIVNVDSSTSGGGAIVTKIFIIVILPLVLGQCSRVYALSVKYDFSYIPISTVSSGTLLLIIYSAFCDMFSQQIPLEISTVVATMICIVCIQLGLSMAMFTLAKSKYTKFSRGDVVAAVFCGTHKSLTLGLPLLNLIFGSESKELPILSIPLLMYHPLQIVCGSVLAPHLKTWMSSLGDIELTSTPKSIGSPGRVSLV